LFYEKPKKSGVGLVIVYLLLGGVAAKASGDLNANSVVFCLPAMLQRSALPIALYGFVGGF